MSRTRLASLTIRLQVALVAIFLVCGVASATDNRVALIVGNADYRHAPHLATPRSRIPEHQLLLE